MTGSAGQLVREGVQRETGRLAGSEIGASGGARIGLRERSHVERQGGGVREAGIAKTRVRVRAWSDYDRACSFPTIVHHRQIPFRH